MDSNILPYNHRNRRNKKLHFDSTIDFTIMHGTLVVYNDTFKLELGPNQPTNDIILALIVLHSSNEQAAERFKRDQPVAKLIKTLPVNEYKVTGLETGEHLDSHYAHATYKVTGALEIYRGQLADVTLLDDTVQPVTSYLIIQKALGGNYSMNR